MEKLPDGDKEVSSTQPSQTEIKRIEETRYELRDASGEVRCTVAVQFDYRIPGIRSPNRGFSNHISTLRSYRSS